MRARIAGVAASTAAVAVLAACGGGYGAGSASSTTSGPASSATSGSGSEAAATTVAVTAQDFSFTLPQTAWHPGRYTFEMTNDGSATHAMEIDGPGAEDQKSGTAGPGAKASLTVSLQAGTYPLYCPVDGHRSMGMQTTFRVG